MLNELKQSLTEKLTKRIPGQKYPEKKIAWWSFQQLQLIPD